MGFVAFDDLIHGNTQTGSQWDGFRHWGHQEVGLYYNGLKHDEMTALSTSRKTVFTTGVSEEGSWDVQS